MLSFSVSSPDHSVSGQPESHSPVTRSFVIVSFVIVKEPRQPVW
jgi:hypothetical protein